jgi:hypothetical protein
MVTFYYEISKLIDRAQIESILLVKSIKNKETGLPELEELAIADEDEKYIRKLLKNIANEIYERLSLYSRTLETIQVDTITLTGSDGTAEVTGTRGLTKLVTFDTDLATTAENFVTDHADAYLSEGIIVESDGSDIIFTARTEKIEFTSPIITNATEDLSGIVVNSEKSLKGLEFEGTYIPDEGDFILDCIIFRIIKPTYFDNEVILPLENAIENALIHYTVSEFLFRNGVDGTIHLQRYLKNKDDILTYIIRRTKLKRSYKLY